MDGADSSNNEDALLSSTARLVDSLTQQNNSTAVRATEVGKLVEDYDDLAKKRESTDDPVRKRFYSKAMELIEQQLSSQGN